MKLSELVREVGPGRLRVLAGSSGDADPDIVEVVLADGLSPTGPGILVLALPGTGAAAGGDAAALGAQRPGGEPVSAPPTPAALGAEPPVPESPVVVPAPGSAATELFGLLQAALHAGDELGRPGSIQAIADYTRATVGGAVVVYDRAHRVLAHSVGDFPIDAVRRDTILGRRTPDDWIARFTADRTAYRTRELPGRVVRVDEYEDIVPRLRIAVTADGEVVGELSVSEDAVSLGAAAELALARAGRLAVPALRAHQRVVDRERTERTEQLRGLLWHGREDAELSGRDRGMFVCAFAPAGGAAAVSPSGVSTVAPGAAHTVSHGVAPEPDMEQIVHYLALSFRALSPEVRVAAIHGVVWIVVPGPPSLRAELIGVCRAILGRMRRVLPEAAVAVAEHLGSAAGAPDGRAVVEDLLRIHIRAAGSVSAAGTGDLGNPGATGDGGHAEPEGRTEQVFVEADHWAPLLLARVGDCLNGCSTDGTAGLADGAARPRNPSANRTPLRPRTPTPIDVLAAHDAQEATDFTGTLRVFFAEFGQVSRAAARLHLHPNTLRHRLRRIQEISGLDIGDAGQRLAAELLLIGNPRSDPGPAPAGDTGRG
ncbi:helix-turn-helix domain-containing protein [Brevibacterium moorei]|uniref:helix-turn-helix domain-containing protein n=1 Tax=Brevibacterium moorei TaxID=2968457 RepID=UPI00211CF8F5|nr:helix-turn-helix domain-containing protein [Brevibacterium sp. 68QC2CO]MCQ9386121.1 helix-turn-helix domain-containing protein [Brevibacterium sp. 68QC2CO]